MTLMVTMGNDERMTQNDDDSGDDERMTWRMMMTLATTNC